MMKSLYAIVAVIVVLLAIFSSTPKVQATVNATPSSGWDIFNTNGSTYRYGPSFIVNADNSIDMWTCSNGGPRPYDNFTISGTHTAVQLTGSNVAAQKFTSTQWFGKVQVRVPTYFTSNSGITLKLYKWNTDYSTTIAGNALATQTFTNVVDNSILTLNSTNDFGTFLWTLSSPVNSIGVWKYSLSSMPNNVNYLNGATVSGDYEMTLEYNETDYIRHSVSTNGGATFGSETIALQPTPGSSDGMAACDPGVIKFGGFYYLGYTSNILANPRANEVYLAHRTLGQMERQRLGRQSGAIYHLLGTELFVWRR